MRKTIIVAALAVVLGLIPLTAKSQLSVSYYSSNLSKIGLAYDFTQRFWSEVRLYGDTDIGNITPELVFCFNLSSKEFHRIYLGFGGNVNFFTGFVMPVGVQFTPFEKFSRFSLHIELEPTLDIGSEDMIIQASWGLRYRFLKQD
ncbi:MAG: hypothetical protein QUS66_08335 [Bacteroidota bacterium]|nr:hypothetical protein [Bacteroidota bacterium]